MKFKDVALLFQAIESTSSGNEMREICAVFLKKVPVSDIGLVCHLMLGEISSEFSGKPLGMAEKMVVKALEKISGKDLQSVFKKKGDVGLVAEQIISGNSRLTVKDVFSGLTTIASASGSGSQDVKIDTLLALLKKSSSLEARYLCRIVVGKLRLGASHNTIFDALAIAFTGDKKNKKEIERAYLKNPDIGSIASIVASEGLKKIGKTSIMLFRPVKMMLCQRVKSLDELKDRLGLMAIEDKMDGERIQVHKSGNEIKLFSRRMENITSQFPDVVASCKKYVSGKEYIIEGEVLPIDKSGKVLPFQLLMQRRRKYNVEEYIKKIPVMFFVFELIYYNGKSYIPVAYPERRKKLEGMVKKSKHVCMMKRLVTKDVSKVQKFFTESLKRGSEGIVAKGCTDDSIYSPGARGYNWIKWKKEYVSGMQDTFDLVVIGALYGKGKRSSKYGALLCAVYNITKKKYESFCKVGSGFTDKVLAELPGKLRKYERVTIAKNVASKLKADVWFKPGLVIEVLGAEVTRSSLHTANIKDGKGLALRFPRFVRYRTDKRASQATSVKEIKGMVR